MTTFAAAIALIESFCARLDLGQATLVTLDDPVLKGNQGLALVTYNAVFAILPNNGTTVLVTADRSVAKRHQFGFTVGGHHALLAVSVPNFAWLGADIRQLPIIIFRCLLRYGMAFIVGIVK